MGSGPNAMRALLALCAVAAVLARAAVAQGDGAVAPLDGAQLSALEAADLPSMLGDSVEDSAGRPSSHCAGEKLKHAEQLGALRNQLKIVNDKMNKEKAAREKAEREMSSLKKLVESKSSGAACAAKVEVERQKLR